MAQNFSKRFSEQVINGWAGRENIYDQERFILNNYLLNSDLSVLEAGTGGGVMSFFIEESLSFKNIHAFDVIPEMIDIANNKAKKNKSKVNFSVNDAADLSSFKDEKFDYLVYLQQVLCMVPQKHLSMAIKEAYRVGAKNSVYIFSFLDWDSRWYNPILSFIINSARLLFGRKMLKYYLPEVNKTFFRKDQQGILWAKKSHIFKMLEDVGLTITNFYTHEKLVQKKGRTFFIVCEKK